MNAPANFPLPYEGEQPNDAVAQVLARLRVVGHVLEQSVTAGMTADVVSDIRSVLLDVEDDLAPILAFLNKLESPDTMNRYRAARREVIAASAATHPLL